MAAATSPVTPTVVAWAIEEDGRSFEDLAEALKVPVDDVQAWASGDAAPTRGQVTSLAKELRRPRVLFFMPAPPEAASLPSSFRHPPGVARNVSPKIRRAGRESRRIQATVAWARREAEPVDVPILSPASTSAVQAARVVREWLGIEEAVQLRWKTEYQALAAWREALEARGLLVFALQLGADEVRGFSTWDDHAPLIAFNTSGVTPPARIFTMGHELGHLVARLDATCLNPDEVDLADGPVIERWCEEFAAALLMPSTLVRTVTEEAGIAAGEADLETVKLLMRRARVSGRAAALRLIALGWASPHLYGAVVAAFRPAKKSSGTPQSPPRYEARLRSYGSGVIQTVFEALPTLDALRVLRIEVPDARRLAAEMPELRVP
ncbi:ImmA/IrrE family metallo-endopeptidase [Pseudonocardia oroxyli]|uniref:Zn-dependent peptidase ImmA, M78 family n=1 Tax=Pseudonocardia oroxyli TaxID=366584 RepID=A0A1G7SVT8_PSEOR|nr:ImmA/IrrE family metallo-endopeptidase [Pseudonocardia oroxyli]SDG27163.1 Zn-dependent peptidase ImmA, M78 family [Pseudonocardia oroxyli]